MKSTAISLFLMLAVPSFAETIAFDANSDEMSSVYESARDRIAQDYLREFAATWDYYLTGMGMEQGKAMKAVDAAVNRTLNCTMYRIELIANEQSISIVDALREYVARDNSSALHYIKRSVYEAESKGCVEDFFRVMT